MGQECNIFVIYDIFFYVDTPIIAIFAHPDNISHIFRSKNKKTFSHISKSMLVAAHPAWPEMLENRPVNVAAQEKTPPELFSAAFFKADGEIT
ncbi:hypothetical protein DXT88_13785 [Herbaspirillum lusitanum]|uniref:hypothetical protein n=1 Tax=Herbaspirillum lusitanum TaxID=213312 RepID=UPI0022386E6B|nr:hypothetical protein [Herbaspirillum lusitanum]MCW5299247.1 hypothetical protein [Herbaspirillum lusitanum]